MSHEHRRRAWLWAAFAVGLSHGCAAAGDDGRVDANAQDTAPTDGDAMLSARELCQARVSQQRHTQRCTQGRIRSALNLAEHVLAHRCRPGSPDRRWAEALIEAAQSERIAIDWAAARDCLDRSRQLRARQPGIELVQSDAWQQLVNGVCSSFYVGLLGRGETCKDDWDCQAGLGCYTLEPTQPDSKECQPPAGMADACDPNFYPCAAGLRCEAGACLPLVGPGGSCSSHAECLSGRCGGSPQRCAPTPPQRELGEPCYADAECSQPCTTCRPVGNSPVAVCSYLGARGDACKSMDDCAAGLGCIDGTCGTVGRGAPCGPGPQAACKQGLQCLAPIRCESFEERAECEAHAEHCSMTPDGCRLERGTCTAPVFVGPCAFGHACGRGSYCNADATCVAFAKPGEACATEGDDPRCVAGYACIDGRCSLPCAYKRDCPQGQYCNTDANPASCAPLPTTGCTNSNQCGPDAFCSQCNGLSNAAACNANDTCSWTESGYCRTTLNCARYDGDQASCEEQADCGYNSDNGWCDPVINCSTKSKSECEENASCNYSAFSYCASTSGVPQGRCVAKRKAGAPCVIEGGSNDGLGESQMCASGYCMQTDTEGARCTVRPSGCTDRSQEIVGATFLFGMVVVTRRRRRSD